MPKEGRFYVEYLGWKETRGLYGSEFTDPIMNKLLSRRQLSAPLHRMTIKVGKENIQISQDKTSGPNGRSHKIKYPPQPMCDVSYVTQCAPPHTDVVACIFLGYNMYTQCAAHAHAYRFDSPDTATNFVKLISSVIEQTEFRQRILAMEHDLLDLGHIHARSSRGPELKINHDTMGSDAGSYGSHSPNSSDSGIVRSYPTAEQALKQRKDIVIKRTPSNASKPKGQLFTTIHDELAQKLQLQQGKEAQILLPPKDYDTIVRRHGHLSIRAKVKQRSVVGADSIFKRTEDANNNASKIPSKRDSATSQTRSTSLDDDDADSGSTHSDEPSVYGLYKGLKQDNGYNLAQDEMAMWSPEFSFGHQTTSSQASSGFNSSTGSGLRRMKATSMQ